MLAGESFHEILVIIFFCQHATGKFHTWEVWGRLTLPEIEFDFSHASESLGWHLALFNYKLRFLKLGNIYVNFWGLLKDANVYYLFSIMIDYNH